MPKSDIEVPKSNSSVFLFSPHPHHAKSEENGGDEPRFSDFIKECYKFMTVHQS